MNAAGRRKKCNIRSVAAGGRGARVPRYSTATPCPEMTTQTSSLAATKKKLLSRIAAGQRQAGVAKKTAKLAKLGFRAAKGKFKNARRMAKKLRKAIKSLKLELAALGAKKNPRKRPATTRAVKRPKPTPKAVAAPVEAAPIPPEVQASEPGLSSSQS